jgi:hypothetical protein
MSPGLVCDVGLKMTSHDVAADTFMEIVTAKVKDLDDDTLELLKVVFRATVEKMFPVKGKKEKSSEQEEESSSSSAEASSEEEKPKKKTRKQSKPRKPAKKSAYSFFRSDMTKGIAKGGQALSMKDTADKWNREFKGKPKAVEKYQKQADAYNKKHGL